MLPAGEEEVQIVVGQIAQGAAAADPLGGQNGVRGTGLLRPGHLGAQLRGPGLPGPRQQGLPLRLGGIIHGC